MPTRSPSPSPLAHSVRTILILSFAPVIGIGLARFGYSLVLPDMRDSLDWSYATAGSMNTINAIGYLVGAFAAAPAVRRFGLLGAVWIGTLACVASLALFAISGHVTIFGAARLLSGVGAAVAFVSGGALATSIAQARPAQSALLIGLFYTGPASGIVISGLVAPFLLEIFGAGSWWIVWIAFTAIATLMTVPLLRSRVDLPPEVTSASPARVRLWPILPHLAGYFIYGAGYIAYMTFMIAYIRNAGGSAVEQSLFWCLIGAGGFAAPWAWRRLMARGQSGMALAFAIGGTAIGAGLALLGNSAALFGVSALVFGCAFLAVVNATTAFAKFNYPPAAWPKVIGIQTMAFGLGQTLGPIATGAITDALGSLSYALVISTAALALGAIVSAFQRPLTRPAA